MVGGTAPTLGLLCVGAGIDLRKLRAQLRTTSLVAVIKLLLYPAAGWLALHLAGLSGLDVTVPVLIMACPTAVISYIMAREMRGSESLAGAIVIGTTLASLATLLLWLALLVG